jgi:uncharacterized protein YqkB
MIKKKLNFQKKDLTKKLNLNKKILKKKTQANLTDPHFVIIFKNKKYFF